MRKGGIIAILIILIASVIIFFKYNSPKNQPVETPKSKTQDSVYVPTIKYGINIDSFEVHQHKIKPNEFLANILLKHHVPYPEIDALVRASDSIFDVRKIASGHNYTILAKKDSTEKAAYFIYEINDIIFILYGDEIVALDFKDGNQLWFVNYEDIPIVQAKGGQINNFFNNVYFLLPNGRLGAVDLFLGSKSDNKFIPFQSESTQINKIDQYDKILFSGSLGRLFRNTQNEFPKKSFLKSDKNIKNKIKEIMNKISSKPKIGIGWKSKREFYGDSKSIDLSSMINIFSIKELSFINLQYGDVEKELIDFENKNNIKIFSIKGVDLFNDFEKISAVLENLDLFITISNSTAHLAGALGVPTWLIKPKKKC